MRCRQVSLQPYLGPKIARPVGDDRHATLQIRRNLHNVSRVSVYWVLLTTGSHLSEAMQVFSVDFFSSEILDLLNWKTFWLQNWSFCAMKEKSEAEVVSRTAKPDGGYGWIVCCGTFIVNFVVFGIHNSFGVVYVNLLDDLDLGEMQTGKRSWCELP